jgi:hypothetical protein
VNYWRQATCDDSNRVSSARIISLTAGITLCIATLALTFGSFWVPAMLPTLAVFGPSLAGLAAGNYMMQRYTTRTEKNEV